MTFFITFMINNGLVGAIIRSQYSIDQELASINSGGDRHAEFLAFRDLARQLARAYTG